MIYTRQKLIFLNSFQLLRLLEILTFTYFVQTLLNKNKFVLELIVWKFSEVWRLYWVWVCVLNQCNMKVLSTLFLCFSETFIRWAQLVRCFQMLEYSMHIHISGFCRKNTYVLTVHAVGEFYVNFSAIFKRKMNEIWFAILFKQKT